MSTCLRPSRSPASRAPAREWDRQTPARTTSASLARRRRARPFPAYRRGLHRGVPEALYFTDSDEANELIASDPLAPWIGFAIDQQVTVQQAFQGPLRLKQRIGTPRRRRHRRDGSGEPGRTRSASGLRSTASRGRWQAACRNCARSPWTSTPVGPSRIWTEAADAADLRKRIGSLPGFGKMKITGLGSVLCARFGVEVASVRPRPPLPRRSRLRGGARRLPGAKAGLQERPSRARTSSRAGRKITTPAEQTSPASCE